MSFARGLYGWLDKERKTGMNIIGVEVDVSIVRTELTRFEYAATGTFLWRRCRFSDCQRAACFYQ